MTEKILSTKKNGPAKSVYYSQTVRKSTAAVQKQAVMPSIRILPLLLMFPLPEMVQKALAKPAKAQ